MSETSLGEYTIEEEYAPFCDSSMNPGTCKGKLWLSTTCQWNMLISEKVGLNVNLPELTLTLTQLIASRVRLMSETGKLRTRSERIQVKKANRQCSQVTSSVQHESTERLKRTRSRTRIVDQRTTTHERWLVHDADRSLGGEYLVIHSVP